jgi:hypothetical protein
MRLVTAVQQIAIDNVERNRRAVPRPARAGSPGARWSTPDALGRTPADVREAGWTESGTIPRIIRNG